MTRLGSSLRAALPLALLLGTTSLPAVAADVPADKPADQRTVDVYRQGDNFVVAVYRADGSATLGVVAAKNVKPDTSGSNAAKVDLADLMEKGRVIYTVRIAPQGTPSAEATNGPDDKLVETIPQTRPANSVAAPPPTKAAAALERKRRIEFARQFKAMNSGLGGATRTVAAALTAAAERAAAAEKGTGAPSP
jgi:hypothetical protein